MVVLCRPGDLYSSNPVTSCAGIIRTAHVVPQAAEKAEQKRVRK